MPTLAACPGIEVPSKMNCFLAPGDTRCANLFTNFAVEFDGSGWQGSSALGGTTVRATPNGDGTGKLEITIGGCGSFSLGGIFTCMPLHGLFVVNVPGSCCATLQSPLPVQVTVAGGNILPAGKEPVI